MAPGLKEQLATYPKSTITVEELKQYLLDIFRTSDTDDVIFSQGCKTHGIVNRRKSKLNICDDPTCPSCSALAKELHDQLTNEKNKT